MVVMLWMRRIVFRFPFVTVVPEIKKESLPVSSPSSEAGEAGPVSVPERFSGGGTYRRLDGSDGEQAAH